MKIIAGLALACLSTTAFADLVTNGDFESNVVVGVSYTAVDAVSLPGWTVSAGTVDQVSSFYWLPQSGNQSMDLSGTSAGAITQTLTTASGTDYRLRFYMAGNPGSGSSWSMNVMVGSVVNQNFTFNSFVGQSVSNMGWTLQTITFTANAASMALTFTSLTAGSFGPTLDLVSVNEIPEPSTYALFGLGIAGLGFWRRRTAKSRAAKS